jgi:predicted ATPase
MTEDRVVQLSGERLEIKETGEKVVAAYRVERGELKETSVKSPMPPVPLNQLYLVVAAGFPEFRGVYETLQMMGFYNFNPESMREIRAPDAGAILDRDGGNIASVIGRIDSERPEVKERISGYLPMIVPGITDVNRVALGPFETLEFRQTVRASEPPRTFYPTSMSDGTLRALGALVAVAQPGEGTGFLRLVGIEEPETALHPAASAVLMDALREAAVETQVVVTTHSADLLDRLDPDADRLLVVEMRQGVTVIGSINRASREAIGEHLYSPGELLRMDQLRPDYDDLQRQASSPEPAGRSG